MSLLGDITGRVAAALPSLPDSSAFPDLRGGLGRLRDEIDERVDRIDIALNEYGYDPWGFNPEAFKSFILPSAILYRYWFRAQVRGLENIPAGRVLLIGNHAGQIAVDGAMISTALLLDGEPPRLGRGMGEYWLARLPWLSVMVDRAGSAIGTRKTCVDMLADGQCVIAFPEGVRGMNKVYADAYKLMPFGLGFLRLALETDTPIVPVSVVGSEEQNPGIANLEGLGRVLGMPAFPITMTFPWLGPLGMMPMPVRYHIEFGKPLHFEGDADDEDEVIQEKVDVVRAAISQQLDEGRARRKSIFL